MKFAPKSREQRPSLNSFVIRVAYSKGGGGDFARIGVGVTWVSGKMEGGSFAANSV